MAENCFLLTLDGDIDFQPNAVSLLVDLMKKNKNLGAACGRIHPVGTGPMVWYQVRAALPFPGDRVSKSLLRFLNHSTYYTTALRVRHRPLAAEGHRAHDRMRHVFARLLLALQGQGAHGRQRDETV